MPVYNEQKREGQRGETRTQWQTSYIVVYARTGCDITLFKLKKLAAGVNVIEIAQFNPVFFIKYLLQQIFSAG